MCSALVNLCNMFLFKIHLQSNDDTGQKIGISSLVCLHLRLSVQPIELCSLFTNDNTIATTCLNIL